LGEKVLKTSEFLKEHPEVILFAAMVFCGGLWLYANHIHNNSMVQNAWVLVAQAFSSITTLVMKQAFPTKGNGG
jgi:hypothetical protein